MQACGVDTSAVYFSQPDSGTDALNIVRKLVSSNTVDQIVVDKETLCSTGPEGQPYDMKVCVELTGRDHPGATAS
jgi:hypothetical protein